MHNKKGIEMTFNWIFSIIAGTLIFLFFVGFAAENMDLFGKITAIRVSEELNSAFSGLKTGLVSTSLSFNKEIKLQFKCIDGEREKLIVGFRSGKDLYDNLVFSPETLEGNEFLLMTKAWNVPYKVDNFIFVSDKNNKYYLESEPDNLISNLPDDFKGLITNNENEATKKIYFNSNCGSLSNGDVNINYQKDSSDNFYGTICGKDSKGDFLASLDFYGDAMIYAAIFGEQFNCLYPLMEEKLKIMRDVYIKKIDNVGACGTNIKTNINSLNEIKNIKSSFETIKDLNEKIIGDGCSAIF